jgi:hypothetical protein
MYFELAAAKRLWRHWQLLMPGFFLRKPILASWISAKRVMRIDGVVSADWREWDRPGNSSWTSA